MNKFYIELPADDGGNTSMPLAVIEGQIVQGGATGSGIFSNPNRRALIITAPPSLAQHEGMYVDQYGGFAEVSGPARMLSREEYQELLRSVQS